MRKSGAVDAVAGLVKTLEMRPSTKAALNERGYQPRRPQPPASATSFGLPR